jgi:3-isopropylmalate dehydrogenase
VERAIREGYRTADIFTPGTKKVNTRQMAEAIQSYI